MIPADLRQHVLAWISEDPDPGTRAELEGLLEAGDGRGAGRPLRRRAGVRHRRAARRARGGAAADEPGRGAARRGRPRGLPPRAGCGRGRRRRDRVRRPPPLRRLRPRHRRGRRRGRDARPAAPPAAADPAARPRDPRPGLRGGRDGDRQPQPAAGQRLQGLPRRRQPDRAARRRSRSPPASRPSARSPRCPAGPTSASRCSATTWSTATSPTWSALAGSDGPRDLVTVYTPLHGVGGDTVATVLREAGFAGAPRGGRAGRARPRLPDRGLPQPRGARGDGPRAGAAPPRSAPTSWWPTTPTPTAAPSPSRARTAGSCCGATRWARCWPPTCSDRGARGTWATSIVSSSLLGKLAAAARPGVRRDADRLQVDRPGPRPGLRLRGGARLLRRPGPRARQGRRLGAAAGLRPRRPAQGRGPHPARPARRPRPRARPARDRPALGADGRPRGHPRGGRPAALGPARRRWAASPSSRSTTSRRAPDRVCPPTNGLRLRLAEGGRVVVRPSGTEPKLKCYLEVVVPVDAGGVDAARIVGGGTAGRDPRRPGRGRGDLSPRPHAWGRAARLLRRPTRFWTSWIFRLRWSIRGT